MQLQCRVPRPGSGGMMRKIRSGHVSCRSSCRKSSSLSKYPDPIASLMPRCPLDYVADFLPRFFNAEQRCVRPKITTAAVFTLVAFVFIAIVFVFLLVFMQCAKLRVRKLLEVENLDHRSDTVKP